MTRCLKAYHTHPTPYSLTALRITDGRILVASLEALSSTALESEVLIVGEVRQVDHEVPRVAQMLDGLSVTGQVKMAHSGSG